ncbi:MAG: iron-sulfur cluster assembly scaffold protein [Bacteroidales bacterium]|nr:iron-sulfur cluster assembly scaffold protein [Bacteroidales bacterium]
MEKHISNLHKLGLRSLPTNFGPLRNANANARIKGQLGNTIELWLRIEDEKIQQATFVTDGCHSSLVCGTLTAWIAEGKTITEALQLTPTDVFRAAGEQVEAHCAILAIKTLRASLTSYLQQQNSIGQQLQKKEIVKPFLLNNLFKLKI